MAYNNFQVMSEIEAGLSELQCPYAGVCGGCSSIHLPYSEQKASKITALKKAWAHAKVSAPLPEVEFRAIASGGLRDRADFVIDRRSENARVGLFQTATREVLDLESCAQLSPALDEFYREVREILPHVDRGSFRIRVAPDGARGIWLDLANMDVKSLLEGREQLLRLQSFAFVEIGQRRKALVEKNGALKLGDPELRPWFETYLGEDEKPVPIYTTVGGFTQPGFVANRALIRALRECLKDVSFRRAAEFGSGSGNLTLPLAFMAGEKVLAYEVDELAVAGLRKSADAAGLAKKIEIHQGNFHKESNAPTFDVDLVLVDPPRSGLMGFISSLSTSQKHPKHFVYVSCFADSFSQDAAKLIELGYKPKRAIIVDQFPQSEHFEIVALFER